MTRILFYLPDYSPDPWVSALKALDPDLDIRTNDDWGDPEDGPAYAFVWMPPHGQLARYPNIRAVFSLGAGVDHLTSDPDLPKDLPIVRMGDDGLREGMREYVLMGVLAYQRGLFQFTKDQAAAHWGRIFAPAASDTPVGIMGYGALGRAVADALIPMGYPVKTWSRTPKPAAPDVTHFTGTDDLSAFLAASRVVVGLLPDTDATRHLLNSDTLAHMPKGGFVINAGRGGLVDLDALITSLDQGHLSGAMLDVFSTEPLPSDHPAWAHPDILVTPHVAAITRPHSAARYVLDGIAAFEAGQQPALMLDRMRGY